MLLALALGTPELAAIGGGAAVALAIGLLASGEVMMRVRVGSPRPRVLEDDTLRLRLEIDIDSPWQVPASVSLTLPPALRLEAVRDEAGRELKVRAGRLPPIEIGSARKLMVAVVCTRWGVVPLPVAAISLLDPFGFFEVEARSMSDPVRVLPTADRLRRLFAPIEVGARLGDLVSRRRGDGLEFADLRPFAQGDDLRRVNWRASTRAGAWWVNDRRPERNAEIVLLVDALVEASPDLEPVLDRVVHGAASLLTAHLARHDRVGLVALGGTLRWLGPGTGAVQRYRLLDMLLETRARRGQLWSAEAVIAKAIPGHALVVVMTPLLADGSLRVVADLRGRGFDVVVVECPPEEALAAPATAVERLARRIWVMEREEMRRRLWNQGIAVGRWHAERPLAQVVTEVAACRSGSRRPA